MWAAAFDRLGDLLADPPGRDRSPAGEGTR